MPYFGANSTYFLVMIISVVVGLFTQGYIKRTYAKWSNVGIERGITGAEAARLILERNNLLASGPAASDGQVVVQRIPGELSDHYDPRSHVVSLSQAVYDQPSVASVAVAAHEVGHAIQHSHRYVWGEIRTRLVPIVNFGSSAAGILILMGLVINLSGLFWAGIIAYSLAVLFQLVTLPVELNASNRALVQLREAGIVSDAEAGGAKQVLTAAAFTYLGAALISLLYLLYYIGLRRD